MTGVVPNGAATSAASDSNTEIGNDFADLLGQMGMEKDSNENVEVSETSDDFVNPMAALPVAVQQPAPVQLVIDLPLTEDAAQALLDGQAQADAEAETAEQVAPLPTVDTQAAEPAEAATPAKPVVATAAPMPAPQATPVDTAEPADAVAPQVVSAEAEATASLATADDNAPPATSPERAAAMAQPERQPAPVAKNDAARPVEVEIPLPETPDAPADPRAATDDRAVREALVAAERQTARPATPAPATLATLPIEPARKYAADGRLISGTAELPPVETAPVEGNAHKATAEDATDTAQPVSKETPAKAPDASLIAAGAASVVAGDGEVMEAAPQPLEHIQSDLSPTIDPKGSQLSQATVRTTAELAAAMISRLGQRTTRFDMVLTPETLGNVEVSIEVGDDGQMSARLAFENPQAANELRARADELRRQLTEAGFDVSDKSLEFTDRESDPRGGFNQFMSDSRSGRRAFMGAARIAEMADTPVAPVWTPLNLARTGVDMKV